MLYTELEFAQASSVEEYQSVVANECFRWSNSSRSHEYIFALVYCGKKPLIGPRMNIDTEALSAASWLAVDNRRLKTCRCLAT